MSLKAPTLFGARGRGLDERMRSSRTRPVQVANGVLRFLFSIFLAVTWGQTVSVRGEELWQFSDLKPCVLDSVEMTELGSEEAIDPCIVFDIDPVVLDDGEGPNRTSVISSITLTDCTIGHQYRVGALTAIEKINRDNNGKGVAIGFNENHFVKFKHVSVVVGSIAALGGQEYDRLHKQLLESMLVDLRPHFIVGARSDFAGNEVELARKYQTILLAQVGPPSFYEGNNPWLFGMHVSSNRYPIDSVRRLQFYAESMGNRPDLIPVKVIYRTSGRFHHDTCRSAIDALKESGFTDLAEIPFDPVGDEDNDGDENQIDDDFLEGIASQACSAESAHDVDFAPALFMCIVSEQDTMLETFRRNGCRISSMWMTASTWTWARKNPEIVPYFQGGGQWHTAFLYSDRYFESGKALLAYNEERFGILGGYDMVCSYSIPILFSNLLQSVYRVLDDPDPIADFADEARREFLRRSLLNLKSDTLFGPISFDNNQRNAGRGAASTQWLPDRSGTSFRNALVSPISHAEASAIVPAASALPCEAGSFTNATSIATGSSLLSNKCSFCPVDTISTLPNRELSCSSCQIGTSTLGMRGSTYCTEYNDNLLSTGILSFGYAAMGLSWFLGLLFLYWIAKHRKDPIVRIAQIEFLVLICIGGIISSSAILGLTFQAGTDEDTTAASRACRTVPFLYTFGWVLQYASLSAKTLRLYRITHNPHLQRRTASLSKGFWVVMVPIVIDMVIVACWTAFEPLEYTRDESGRHSDGGITTIESIGRCRAPAGTHVGKFLGPLIVHHLILMAATHTLLYKVRDVNTRYQEQRFIGTAAFFAVEVALVGLPILLAARDSVEASFFVMSAILAFDNIGVLTLIFVPKIIFQTKGLDPGVGVGESIMQETHDRAVHRERFRSSAFIAEQSSRLTLVPPTKGDMCVHDVPSGPLVQEKCNSRKEDSAGEAHMLIVSNDHDANEKGEPPDLERAGKDGS